MVLYPFLGRRIISGWFTLKPPLLQSVCLNQAPQRRWIGWTTGWIIQLQRGMVHPPQLQTSNHCRALMPQPLSWCQRPHPWWISW